jgi:hypothetical protein
MGSWDAAELEVTFERTEADAEMRQGHLELVADHMALTAVGIRSGH